MIGRFVLLLIVGALLVSLLIALDLPRPVLPNPLPTPAGQLGGRMPLPTAEGRLGGSLPQNTPVPWSSARRRGCLPSRSRTELRRKSCSGMTIS